MVITYRKKDGSQHFCVDYRRVNQVTKKDARCLESMIHWMHCRGHSTIDLTSGYWQVEMEGEDKEKTAFKHSLWIV